MLSAHDFHVADDSDALARENELLAIENQLLRGLHGRKDATIRREVRKAVLEEREKGREAVHQLREKHRRETEERRTRFASVPHERLARLQKAESDVRAVVKRLNGSLLGPLLRRRGTWRALVERWGE